MKFIKSFKTQTMYEALEPNLILPNVSLTVDNHTIHYNPILLTQSHDYVEIGGIKWATMNVGAESVTDTGLYFQWGDTQGYTTDQVGSGEGKKYFGWTDYKYNGDGSNPTNADMTKYNATDGKIVLEASDDAVTANWGGQWRMPTVDEWRTLSNLVNTGWTTDYQGSGVSGVILTGKTDSSKVLFFPSCGICSNGKIYDVGSRCNYWSSTVRARLNDYINAQNILGSKDAVFWEYQNTRGVGFPVRGVLVDNL